MKDPFLMKCPICEGPESESILSLECGNIDKSKLYPTVKLMVCSNCGHAFNCLTQSELEGLNYYYDNEYAPTNLNASARSGDRPGSSDHLTNERYHQLYTTLLPYIKERFEILDVGCAIGGFLDYLRGKGFSRLSGVDMTETYVEQVRKKNLFNVELGNAEALPFADHSFDVVVMEQVLEHLVNPQKAFMEAKRVLRKGGVFCIGVPDASRYSDFYFFDYYWLLLREHIQHFDVDHLKLLAKQAGFEVLKFRQTSHYVMSDKMIMPNLYIVLRSTECIAESRIIEPGMRNLNQLLLNYVGNEQAKQSIKSRRIAELSESRRPVYAWGIGREFLYLYESAGLKHCNIAGLIDMNRFKQEACSVNGINIEDANSLKTSSDDSVLLITAIAHTDSIMNAVKVSDYKGKIFDLNISSSCFVKQ